MEVLVRDHDGNTLLPATQVGDRLPALVRAKTSKQDPWLVIVTVTFAAEGDGDGS